MATPAKKRKMNFSEREVEIIVEELEKQKHVLINHFNAGVSLLAKNSAWLDILKRVNAVTTCHRELAEVKKKWSDLKTEVRRKVAQVRVAMEGEGDVASAPVILTPMQQRICNLLGEATIISLPTGDGTAEIPVPMPISSTATVTLTQSIQAAPSNAVCEVQKTLEVPAETTYHTLEEGVVEYCTTEPAVTEETPVELIATQPAKCSAKPQELKSRIALNSAKLLQEQRVTNLHVKEIAQHLEQQNDLLQMIRRSQEAQACAQERQAQALEGTQATLHALIQVLRPLIRDFRKYLQSNTASAVTSAENNTGTGSGQQDSTQ
ncbi:nuclear apoptosis-inducing factor 1 [Latimeria chalumnae]|uniref:Nuclear apoptosis inducing factor 1 n=1 Tax=Latimeria chalumnae TaxID=7897 RepID=H3B9I1_LATCH|nr:PREDICTED: nuclear apoptosis-inducing factor 1 isoform X1 [Latimeria chalumnae]|eukprot:XP_005993316.1 PREDICTED: nuclear apoptosis-inducing factor 1 isoform X1 [Latimeria chalumnae]